MWEWWACSWVTMQGAGRFDGMQRGMDLGPNTFLYLDRLILVPKFPGD